MSFEWEPLPSECIPPGWCLVNETPDRIVYRCAESGLRLEAVRTAADHVDPSLGLCQCWELRLGYSIGERDSIDPLTRVSSRRELCDELRSILDRLSAHAPTVSDPLSVLGRIRERYSDQSDSPPRFS
ncbi:hypothetical protein [Halovivax limisalsi]|uniref:hypothetical protein n=1 Tax=Halovivax limisalsi TaxID=1453760 RepID=UPI001FFD25B6|nr:hypothetical protein [Halovivax limisalsi]